MSRIRPYGKKLSIDAGATPVPAYGAGITAWEPLPVFQQDEYFNQIAYELVAGGTGAVQITNAPIEDVEAEIAAPGTIANVVAKTWNSGLVDQGALTEPTIEISPPPTAWRLKSTVGTCIANGRATA